MSLETELAVGINVVVVAADLDIARGQHNIGFVDSAHHIHRAELVRFQLESDPRRT